MGRTASPLRDANQSVQSPFPASAPLEQQSPCLRRIGGWISRGNAQGHHFEPTTGAESNHQLNLADLRRERLGRACFLRGAASLYAYGLKASPFPASVTSLSQSGGVV